MWENTIDPVLVSIGSLDIRYYGLFYAIGFLASYIIIRYLLIKDEANPLKPSDVDDFFLYLMIGGLLGSRLVYVLIYNLPYYIEHPLRIFGQAGMSFHGGLIGGLAGIMLYVHRYNKKHKQKGKQITAYHISDIATIPFAASLALGRIGNFANHELYGRITDVPWAVKFRGIPGYRHPSQLYEAFYSICMAAIETVLFRLRLPRGFMTWAFVGMYGLFRFITEFFRVPDAQIGANGFFFGWMTMGQILSIIMIIASAAMIIFTYKKEMHKYE